MNWRQTLEQWLRIGFNGACPLCQRPAPKIFCQDCLHQLQACQCANPIVMGLSSLPVLSWGIYAGILKRAIALLKYEHQTSIAQPLGQWLGQVWLGQHNAAGQVLVVPIPLHRDRQTQRGYNQAELIAQSFCQFTGLPMRSQGLVRIRSTTAQFGLAIEQRQQNVEGAFRLGPDFQRQRPQAPVLLLDDIYTTGSTVRSAAKTLEASGIRVKGVVAVAQAQRFIPRT